MSPVPAVKLAVVRPDSLPSSATPPAVGGARQPGSPAKDLGALRSCLLHCLRADGLDPAPSHLSSLSRARAGLLSPRQAQRTGWITTEQHSGHPLASHTACTHARPLSTPTDTLAARQTLVNPDPLQPGRWLLRHWISIGLAMHEGEQVVPGAAVMVTPAAILDPPCAWTGQDFLTWGTCGCDHLSPEPSSRNLWRSRVCWARVELLQLSPCHGMPRPVRASNTWARALNA